MKKVIKQEGHDTEIDLDWAADTAQQAYGTLFSYLDELKEPHTREEKKTLVDGSKTLVNNLVKSLKIATLLADPDVVLDTVFPMPVEIVEKVDPVFVATKHTE